VFVVIAIIPVRGLGVAVVHQAARPRDGAECLVDWEWASGRAQPWLATCVCICVCHVREVSHRRSLIII
jgi:hypothetical protein